MFQFIERCGYAEPFDDNNRRGNYILQFTAHDLGYSDQGGGGGGAEEEDSKVF